MSLSDFLSLCVLLFSVFFCLFSLSSTPSPISSSSPSPLHPCDSLIIDKEFAVNFTRDNPPNTRLNCSSLAEIYLYYDDTLDNLNFLRGIDTVHMSVRLEGNSLLTDLSGIFNTLREVGNDVYIGYSPLTSVSLGSLETAGSIHMEYNFYATLIQAPHLSNVTSTIYMFTNPLVSHIDFPLMSASLSKGDEFNPLDECSAYDPVSSNAADIGSYLQIFIDCGLGEFDNVAEITQTALTSVTFPNLRNSSVIIQNCDSLQSVTFPSLNTVSTLAMCQNFALTQVSVPALVDAIDILFVRVPSLNTVDLSSLIDVFRDFTFHGTAVTHIDTSLKSPVKIPSLQRVQSAYFHNNDLLVNVSFDNVMVPGDMGSLMFVNLTSLLSASAPQGDGRRSQVSFMYTTHLQKINLNSLTQAMQLDFWATPLVDFSNSFNSLNTICYLTVSHNPNLVSLKGLNNVRQIGCYFHTEYQPVTINGNSLLYDYSALYNIQGVPLTIVQPCTPSLNKLLSSNTFANKSSPCFNVSVSSSIMPIEGSVSTLHFRNLSQTLDLEVYSGNFGALTFIDDFGFVTAYDYYFIEDQFALNVSLRTLYFSDNDISNIPIPPDGSDQSDWAFLTSLDFINFQSNGSAMVIPGTRVAVSEEVPCLQVTGMAPRELTFECLTPPINTQFIDAVSLNGANRYFTLLQYYIHPINPAGGDFRLEPANGRFHQKFWKFLTPPQAGFVVPKSITPDTAFTQSPSYAMYLTWTSFIGVPISSTIATSGQQGQAATLTLQVDTKTSALPDVPNQTEQSHNASMWQEYVIIIGVVFLAVFLLVLFFIRKFCVPKYSWYSLLHYLNFIDFVQLQSRVVLRRNQEKETDDNGKPNLDRTPSISSHSLNESNDSEEIPKAAKFQVIQVTSELGGMLTVSALIVAAFVGAAFLANTLINNAIVTTTLQNPGGRAFPATNFDLTLRMLSYTGVCNEVCNADGIVTPPIQSSNIQPTSLTCKSLPSMFIYPTSDCLIEWQCNGCLLNTQTYLTVNINNPTRVAIGYAFSVTTQSYKKTPVSYSGTVLAPKGVLFQGPTPTNIPVLLVPVQYNNLGDDPLQGVIVDTAGTVSAGSFADALNFNQNPQLIVSLSLTQQTLWDSIDITSRFSAISILAQLIAIAGGAFAFFRFLIAVLYTKTVQTCCGLRADPQAKENPNQSKDFIVSVEKPYANNPLPRLNRFHSYPGQSQNIDSQEIQNDENGDRLMVNPIHTPRGSVDGQYNAGAPRYRGATEDGNDVFPRPSHQAGTLEMHQMNHRQSNVSFHQNEYSNNINSYPQNNY